MPRASGLIHNRMRKPLLRETDQFNWRFLAAAEDSAALQMRNTSAPLRRGFFRGRAEIQANGEGLDRLAAEPRSPPRIPRAQSPRTLAEVGRSRNPAGGNRRGLRSHNSDSRGIGGDRGLSNSRSIISHARGGKGSNLFDNEPSNCGPAFLASCGLRPSEALMEPRFDAGLFRRL